MTDAPDESPKPDDWYIAWDKIGVRTAVAHEDWIGKNLAAFGWTLGPSLDDLMRDATRYRWLKEKDFIAADLWEEKVPLGYRSDRDRWPTADELIDAEIARDKLTD